jgi:hypothetical protein
MARQAALMQRQAAVLRRKLQEADASRKRLVSSLAVSPQMLLLAAMRQVYCTAAWLQRRREVDLRVVSCRVSQALRVSKGHGLHARHRVLTSGCRCVRRGCGGRPGRRAPRRPPWSTTRRSASPTRARRCCGMRRRGGPGWSRSSPPAARCAFQSPRAPSLHHYRCPPPPGVDRGKPTETTPAEPGLRTTQSVRSTKYAWHAGSDFLNIIINRTTVGSLHCCITA